ncbi:MAG: C-type lectin domain-containing protein [Phycisphaerales bacterium]
MYRKVLASVMMISFLGALGASRLGAGPATLGTPNDPLLGQDSTGFIIRRDINGHAYAVVLQQMSWEGARDVAASQLLLGVPGHLATITSADENDFVVSVINAFESLQDVQHNLLWLGGEQIPHNEPKPAEGWTWITGERWSYTNWAPGEPNDAAGGEYYLAIYGNGNPDQTPGTWNDDLSGAGNTGFIIEWTTPSCPWDFDGDGVVGASDLLTLLVNWGACP